MQDQITYLKPGFFVTLSSVGHALAFTQLGGNLRKGVPWRLSLIDALNEGYQGDLEDLVQALVKQFDAKPPAIRSFIRSLRAAGHLEESGSAPKIVFGGELTNCEKDPGDDELALVTPLSLVTQSGRYLCFDHEGDLLLQLTITEVIAAALFSQPKTVAHAWQLYLDQGQAIQLHEAEFKALAGRLVGAGLLAAPHEIEDPLETPLIDIVTKSEVQALVDARVAAHDERMLNSGKNLVQVVPVNTEKGMAPASLGLLTAYAMEYDGGRLNERYDFVPMFLTDQERLVDRASTPGVYFFSNYLWTVEVNLQLAAAVKAVNPANITVHGGPSTPSYERDCEEFFIDNPQVDIAVRGEGELTFAELLDHLDILGDKGLQALGDTPGMTYRIPGGVHRTPDRDRIPDLNSIPSPYLMGLFDEFGSVRAGAVIESNRGCPYGCTFCDWGSATLSKVRRFDLDRVFKELEWSAKHQIQDASIADANFGMLPRDVDIAKKIAALRRKYDFPRSVPINYAKNQVRYLREIIEIFSAVDILTEGLVSLQSMDETTLKVIDRSNIKLEKYHEISTEFRRANLPLAADIMMGLPGSTRQSFSNDLQQCADLDIKVRANRTTLLPNSPMNEPGYREKYGIVAKPGEILMEAASYTREDWEEMDHLRNAYYLFDGYGLLRYVARFVRSETGLGEVAFYDRVRREALADEDTWPVIATTLKTLQGYMAPPGSWGLFIDEIRQFLTKKMDIEDNSSLRTVLAVQLAHLPSPAREFPVRIELEHDYVTWQDVVLRTREEGHREDWQDHTPKLSEFGPVALTIDDPNSVCRRDVGKHMYVLGVNLHSWELESPVARPRM